MSIVEEIPQALKEKNPYVRQRFLKSRDLLAEVQPKVILDIGCNDGLFLSLFDQSVEKYGLDIEDRSADLPSDIKFAQQDITKGLPYEAETFDAINCAEVIEHVHDTLALLGEILRILKPGGRLVLSTPNLHYWRNIIEWMKGNQFFYVDYHDEQEGHVRYFCAKTLSELSAKVGFDTIKILSVGDSGGSNPILKLTAKFFEKLSKNKNFILIMSADKK